MNMGDCKEAAMKLHECMAATVSVGAALMRRSLVLMFLFVLFSCIATRSKSTTFNNKLPPCSATEGFEIGF
jgi:hypothetical protein